METVVVLYAIAAGKGCGQRSGLEMVVERTRWVDAVSRYNLMRRKVVLMPKQ